MGVSPCVSTLNSDSIRVLPRKVSHQDFGVGNAVAPTHLACYLLLDMLSRKNKTFGKYIRFNCFINHSFCD